MEKRQTHKDKLKQMFMTHPFVLISEIRPWCAYTARISELRQEGFDIQPVMVMASPGTKPVHAFRMIQKEMVPA